MLYWPLQWFGQVNNWMSQAFTGAERVFEILDTAPEAYEAPDALPMPRIAGRVTFRHVSFGYDPSQPVLHAIDLDVAPGELIGLVGRSGAGKTTTMNLLCRFYDVDHGAIAIDGVDIRNIRLADLRNQLGVVLQEPFLFSGTIADNISYGRPGASFEEIVQAAKVANAHRFILAKPDGYDTEVGERGSNLSGGERQRLAIARAILRDPKLLIFDEATASLDTHSEHLIQEAIRRLAKNRTTFVIAHRLSTVRHADRLVVLEEGRVVEVGTYEELLARQGVFYNLVRFQQEVSQAIAVAP
jgi:ATP-binding cassette subfamily B protein